MIPQFQMKHIERRIPLEIKRRQIDNTSHNRIQFQCDQLIEESSQSISRAINIEILYYLLLAIGNTTYI